MQKSTEAITSLTERKIVQENAANCGNVRDISLGFFFFIYPNPHENKM